MNKEDIEFEGKITIFNDELDSLGAQIRDASDQDTSDAEFALDVISILWSYCYD